MSLAQVRGAGRGRRRKEPANELEGDQDRQFWGAMKVSCPFSRIKMVMGAKTSPTQASGADG